MSDRDAIANLFADYAWANDAKDTDVLRSVWTSDASFVITIDGVAEPYGPFEGRDAIVEFIAGSGAAQTDQRRHVITNLRVTEGDDGVVRARAYLSLHITDGGTLSVTAAGWYDTEVAPEDGAPRFRRMALALDGPF